MRLEVEERKFKEDKLAARIEAGRVARALAAAEAERIDIQLSLKESRRRERASGKGMIRGTTIEEWEERMYNSSVLDTFGEWEERLDVNTDAVFYHSTRDGMEGKDANRWDRPKEWPEKESIMTVEDGEEDGEDTAESSNMFKDGEEDGSLSPKPIRGVDESLGADVGTGDETDALIENLATNDKFLELIASRLGVTVSTANSKGGPDGDNMTSDNMLQHDDSFLRIDEQDSDEDSEGEDFFSSASGSRPGRNKDDEKFVNAIAARNHTVHSRISSAAPSAVSHSSNRSGGILPLVPELDLSMSMAADMENLQLVDPADAGSYFFLHLT